MFQNGIFPIYVLKYKNSIFSAVVPIHVQNFKPSNFSAIVPIDVTKYLNFTNGS